MSRIAAALLCALALAGCANWDAFFYPQTGASSARDERESRQVLELIGYVQKVAALPADEQLREVNASSQSFSKDRGAGAYGRVRLALLLSLPGTGFADDAKAAGLLEPVASADAAGSTSGPMRQFAGLLYSQISERLREQRRATQFKEQLDALKDVERKIIERDQVRGR
jgi:TolA-binding protein